MQSIPYRTLPSVGCSLNVFDELTVCGDSVFFISLFVLPKNILYVCSRIYQIWGPGHAQDINNSRVRWLVNSRETDRFHQIECVLMTLRVTSVTRVAHVQVAGQTVLKCVM